MPYRKIELDSGREMRYVLAEVVREVMIGEQRLEKLKEEELEESLEQNDPGGESSISATAVACEQAAARNEQFVPFGLLSQSSEPWAEVADWLPLVPMFLPWHPEGRKRGNLSPLSGFCHRRWSTRHWQFPPN